MPSLARTHPRIAKHWDPSRNGALSPADVTAGSHARIWWRCERAADHVWQAPVYSRSAGKGFCPFCTHRRTCRSNSLGADRDPRCRRLAREWHPTKNAPLTAHDVVPGSNRRVWWRCAKGHAWATSVANRFRLGSDCPFCSGRFADRDHSLAALYPALAREWHTRLNGSLRPDRVPPGSEKQVHWQCSKVRKHVWRARIGHRTTAGSGCPFCAHQRLARDNSLAALLPRIAAEWHPTRNGRLTPRDVIAGGNRAYWWKCPRGIDHEWKTSIGNRKQGRGCPFCNKKRVPPSESLPVADPVLARQWHPRKNRPLEASSVRPESRQVVWWRCAKGHAFRASPRARRSGRASSWCPSCRAAAARKLGAMARAFPRLVREWNAAQNPGLGIDRLPPGSRVLVWWRCARGHEWRSPLRDRTVKGLGCPLCSGEVGGFGTR